MEKTVKIRAFNNGKQDQPAEEKSESAKPASGLVIKNPQLEEERARSQEYLKKIEQLEQDISQLEQNLRDEKVKSATLADALKKISSMALAAAQMKD